MKRNIYIINYFIYSDFIGALGRRIYNSKYDKFWHFYFSDSLKYNEYYIQGKQLKMLSLKLLFRIVLAIGCFDIVKNDAWLNI